MTLEALDQRELTCVFRVDPGRRHALRRALDAVGPTVEDARALFGEVPRLHFARLVVLPGTPTFLALETNFDGSLDAHLDDLARAPHPRLVRVLSCCVGFERERLREHLAAARVPASAFYRGHPGLTVAHVENDRRVRDALRELLADALVHVPGWSAFSYDRRHAHLVGELARRFPRLAVGDVPTVPPPGLAPLLAGGAVVAGAMAVTGTLVPALGLAWAVHARFEREERRLAALPTPLRREPPEIERTLHEIGLREDEHPQNALTHLVTPKPGLLRAVSLRGTLWAVHQLALRHWNKGELGGIPTIHFARWLLLPDGRLLFFSNYDGSWESYLGEFVDGASEGLTGVWRNTRGFPPSSGLSVGGARREEAFKVWTRACQVPTDVWFSAYPDLSVRNVIDNQRIRRGVQSAVGEEGKRAWLLAI